MGDKLYEVQRGASLHYQYVKRPSNNLSCIDRLVESKNVFAAPKDCGEEHLTGGLLSLKKLRRQGKACLEAISVPDRP